MTVSSLQSNVSSTVQQNLQLSVVVPVFNEEASLRPLYKELEQALATTVSKEFIFVNDASTDNSLQTLKEIQQESAFPVHIYSHDDRSGQTQALATGFAKVKGELIVSLDADLQNNPYDIPQLIHLLTDRKLDCVCAWRKDRDDPAVKKFFSYLANKLRKLFTNLSVHDIACTMRVYRKSAIEKLHLEWEGQHRFIPLMLVKQGLKIDELPVHHRKRKFGESKYRNRRIVKVVSDFFKILLTK